MLERQMKKTFIVLCTLLSCLDFALRNISSTLDFILLAIAAS
jgi:hypothetical protein